MELLNNLATVVAIAVAGVILYAAWREFGLLKRDASELMHDLEVAYQVLKGVPQRDDFAATFDSTNEQLLQLQIFGPVWDEFRESLVVDEETCSVRSARDPYDFLGPRLLDASPVDQRRIEAVPNRLIALGLIFTFLGLILSLLIAGAGLSADTFPEVRAALTALLSAAAFKFVTSIAGIASSIWFTGKRSQILNSIDRLSAAISRQLDHLTAPLRADIVAEATHRELVRQSDLLGRGQEGLATAIATQLDETLRANLSQAVSVAFRPFVDRIDEMGRTIAEMNQDALTNMARQFARELGGAAREHSERMEKLLFQVEQTIEDIPASIAKAATAIEMAGLNFSDVAGAAVSTAEQSLTQASNLFAEVLADAQRSIESIGMSLAQSSDLLEATVGRLEQTERASTERAERTEDALRQAVEQMSQVLNRADAAASALGPMTALAERLDALATAMAATNASHGAIVSRTEETLSVSWAASEALGRTAANYSDSTNKLQAALTGLFEQLAAGIDLFRSRVEETVQRVDEDAARIAARLGVKADRGRRGPTGEVK